ncbi:RHS repeat-associated core domain-containing protein [Pantoea sp. Cy-639]|nr:RHS repeat-associated core domain-containing protein [Pantoea sp. Cy-639]
MESVILPKPSKPWIPSTFTSAPADSWTAILTHLLHAGDLPLGQQQAGDPATTRMFSCTASGSVIADSPEPTAGYSAYGQRFGALASLLGFNGEYLDPKSGWYLLGRGHRAYNPALMRFQAPDTLSPFDEGDINRYAYCQGNPITFTDPTGRASRGIAEKGERGLAQRGERGVELTPEQLWLIANRPSLDWVGIMMESINLVLSYAVAAIMVVSAIFTAGVTAPMAAMAVANAALQTVSFVGSLVYQTSGYTNEAAMEVTKYANYVGTPLSIIDIALSVKGPKANTSPTPPNVTNPAIQDRTPRTSVSSNINDGANSPNDIRRGSAGE